MAGQAKFPEKDFYEVLRNSWEQKRKEQAGPPFRRGVLAAKPSAGRDMGGGKGSAVCPGKSLSLCLFGPGRSLLPKRNREQFDFFAYPTIQFFDGRLANRPFLQEMPDPVTMITWDGWVEIDPETAQEDEYRKRGRARYPRRRQDYRGARLSVHGHPARHPRDAPRPGSRKGLQPLCGKRFNGQSS